MGEQDRKLMTFVSNNKYRLKVAAVVVIMLVLTYLGLSGA